MRHARITSRPSRVGKPSVEIICCPGVEFCQVFEQRGVRLVAFQSTQEFRCVHPPWPVVERPEVRDRATVHGDRDRFARRYPVEQRAGLIAEFSGRNSGHARTVAHMRRACNLLSAPKSEPALSRRAAARRRPPPPAAASPSPSPLRVPCPCGGCPASMPAAPVFHVKQYALRCLRSRCLRAATSPAVDAGSTPCRARMDRLSNLLPEMLDLAAWVGQHQGRALDKSEPSGSGIAAERRGRADGSGPCREHRGRDDGPGIGGDH